MSPGDCKLRQWQGVTAYISEWPGSGRLMAPGVGENVE